MPRCTCRRTIIFKKLSLKILNFNCRDKLSTIFPFQAPENWLIFFHWQSLFFFVRFVRIFVAVGMPSTTPQFRYFWYLVCCLIGRKLKNKQAAPKANTTRWRLPGQQEPPPFLDARTPTPPKERPTGCLEFNFHFPSRFPPTKTSVNFIFSASGGK